MGLLLNVAVGRLRAPARGAGHDARRPSVTAPPRIVIAAGGTAGHVVPAIAIADALRAEGAEVSFVGGQRAEAELVPAGRLRARHDQRRGHQPQQPAEGGPRRRQGRRRGRPPPARSSSERRADAVLGGGGYVAGPVGLAATLAEDPARAHRGRLAPRPHQPRARLARAPRLPRLPARRAATATATASPAAPSRRRSPTAPTPAPSSASAPDETCVLVFGGSLGRALDQHRRAGGVRRRALPRRPHRRHARLPGPASARARTTSCSST